MPWPELPRHVCTSCRVGVHVDCDENINAGAFDALDFVNVRPCHCECPPDPEFEYEYETELTRVRAIDAEANKENTVETKTEYYVQDTLPGLEAYEPVNLQQDSEDTWVLRARGGALRLKRDELRQARDLLTGVLGDS